MSIITKTHLKKHLTKAGIEIVNGNYVRRSDIEHYLMEADWKEALKKFKDMFKPFLNKLVSGILATGLFFGAMGTAKGQDFNQAQKSADKYASVLQDVIKDRGIDLRAEAEAVKDGQIFAMKIKITDNTQGDTKGNVCVIDLTKAGTGDNSFVNAKLKTNTDLDSFGLFHEALCKEVYNSWSKKLING
jgi:hypothetical protein